MTFPTLNSGRVGQGDDGLGRRLLASFLATRARSDVRIDFVACVEGGVSPTTAGNPGLDSLRDLEARGARIASCGTCLDHLGLRERLAIGAVGGMQRVVEFFAAADRVIGPT